MNGFSEHGRNNNDLCIELAEKVVDMQTELGDDGVYAIMVDPLKGISDRNYQAYESSPSSRKDYSVPQWTRMPFTQSKNSHSRSKMAPNCRGRYKYKTNPAGLGSDASLAGFVAYNSRKVHNSMGYINKTWMFFKQSQETLSRFAFHYQIRRFPHFIFHVARGEEQTLQSRHSNRRP